MTNFILLYILSPILNVGFDHLSQKQQKTTLFILFVFFLLPEYWRYCQIAEVALWAY